MNDHLPECGYSPGQPGFGGINSGIPSTQPYLAPSPCICERLRACEKRVNSSNLTMWNHTQQQAQHMIDSGLGIAWKDGFKEALDAAREAVAATFIGWCKDYMNCTDYEHVCGKRREIIAAIDALRLPAKP